MEVRRIIIPPNAVGRQLYFAAVACVEPDKRELNAIQPNAADQDPKDAGPVGFGPTTGDSVIPVSPAEVIAAKSGFKGELIIGACTDEFTMFVSLMTLGKAPLDTTKLAPINAQAAMLKMSVERLAIITTLYAK